MGVAGGATRAALTQHQARRNNMADVSAKDGSQVRVDFNRWAVIRCPLPGVVVLLTSLFTFLGDPGESGRSYLQPDLGSPSDWKGHVSETCCTCNQEDWQSKVSVTSDLTFKEYRIRVI